MKEGAEQGWRQSDGAVNVGREERKSGARAHTEERETICSLGCHFYS